MSALRPGARICLVAHGFPDELLGGTELSVRALAHELVRAGYAVTVIAGSMDWEGGLRVSTERQSAPGGELTVHRIHRADLYFDHWHKSREPRVGALFEELLERERPDLVHVHHWLRLTDDLVARAARVGVPAVVSLHDLWSSCLVTFRVRPDTRRFCDAPLGPDPCLDCASVLQPATPWVDREGAEQRLEQRRASIARELGLARAVVCGSRHQGRAIARWVGADDLEPVLVPPGVDDALPRRGAPSDDGPLVLGAWGHLARLKGADVLLEALRRLRDPRSVRLVLAGGEVEPEFAAELRRLAEGLDVQFHPAFERADLARHPVTDVHLMVSGTRAAESWGLVVDEALLLGIPCLLPAAGAFVERTDGAGWARTYAQADPDALARALEELLADRSVLTAMRAAVPAPADCTLSGSAQAERLVEVYARVVDAGAPDAPLDAPDRDAQDVAAIEAWDAACRGDAPPVPADAAPPTTPDAAPMKILEVVHDYLPGHVGGTEIHAHQMACYLRDRGHEVTVATTERDLEVEEGTVRRRELDGVPIVELIHQREFAHMRESWRHPVSPRVFGELLEEHSPDLVHFHHLAHWGAECIQLAQAAGAEVVVTLNDFHLQCAHATLLRSDGELCERGPENGCTDCLAPLPMPDVADDDPLREFHLAELVRERLETHRMYLARVPRVVCPSRFLADRMVRAGLLREEQVVVKRYGYPGETHPVREVRRDGPLRVGYVGGIYPSKGVHVLVEAVASLPAGAAELDVHGVLEWFPDYVEQLRELAGEAPIRFRGRFAPERIDEVLQALDVLVVPSVWYENMPLTIQEAFRNAVPVVATDLGGMAEAIRHGTDGLLFPRGDAPALAAALAGLAADREQLQALAAGRPEVPPVEAIGAELEQLYRELLGQQPAP